MATAMLAGAVSAAVDNLLYGPSSISLDPNKRLENIERQGWDIKGSQSSMESPEVAGNPDGTPEVTWDTKLYRVMSGAEYQSIIDNGGKFGKYDSAMEEKWFATTPEDAEKWAEMFYPDGQYRMIEITVPTDSLKEMYKVNKLDGIGPAYCGGIDFLNTNMKGLALK